MEAAPGFDCRVGSGLIATKETATKIYCYCPATLLKSPGFLDALCLGSQGIILLFACGISSLKGGFKILCVAIRYVGLQKMLNSAEERKHMEAKNSPKGQISQVSAKFTEL